MIPQTLKYGEEAKGGEHINIRKVMPHDEPDEEERRKMEEVRCFLTNVRWQDDQLKEKEAKQKQEREEENIEEGAKKKAAARPGRPEEGEQGRRQRKR